MVTLKDRPEIQLRDNWLDLLAHELGAGRKIKRIRSHRASWYNRTLIVVFAEGKSRFVRAALVVEVATLPVNEAVILGEGLASLAQNQISQVESLIKLGRSEAGAIAEVTGFRWDGQEDKGNFISDMPGGNDPWPSEQAWQKRGCPAVPLWAWKAAIVNLRSFHHGKLPVTGDWFQIDHQYNDLIKERAIVLYDYFESEQYEEDFDGCSLDWEAHRFNYRGWEYWEDRMIEGGFEHEREETEEEKYGYVSIADRMAIQYGHGSIEHMAAVLARKTIFAIWRDAYESQEGKDFFIGTWMPLLTQDQIAELGIDYGLYQKGRLQPREADIYRFIQERNALDASGRLHAVERLYGTMLSEFARRIFPRKKAKHNGLRR